MEPNKELMKTLLELDDWSPIKWRSAEQKEYYFKMWSGSV